MMFIGDNKDQFYDQEEFLGREVSSLWYYSFDDLAEDVHDIATKYILQDYSTKLYDDATIKWQQQVESNNNAHAHYQLGYYYQHGYVSSDKDYTKAVEHYTAAIEQDYAPAMYDLCSLYGRKGKDVITNFVSLLEETQLIKLKVKMYVKAAAVGQHRKAALQIIQRYKYMKHWRNAIDDLEKKHKIVIKDNSASQAIIADTYNQLGFLAVVKSQGRENIEELKSAYECFQKAGKLGNPSGYLNYGYYKYEDHEEYCGERTRYYLKAAQMGHYLGWYMLMRYLISSEALNAAELDRCLIYLKAASKYQTADFLSQLGVLHLESQLHATSNETVALQYFLQATLSNESMSVESVGRHEFFYVGFMYEHGIAVKKDIAKAAHFYASSIIRNGDSPLALCRLAKLIEKKKISPVDVTDVVKLNELARTYDKSELKFYAHYRLARIFSNREWKSIGLFSNHSSRRHFQGVAMDFVDKTTEQRSRAIDQYIAGKMNECGYFINTDHKKAMHHYELASMCYNDGDVYDRYYSFKAMIKRTMLSKKNDHPHLNELEILNNGIDRLWKSSPIDVFIHCYNIARRYVIDNNIGYQIQSAAFQKYQQQIENSSNANAHYQLGYFYQHGIWPAKKDLTKAMQFYQAAIRLHHPLARYDLCWLYGCEESGDDTSVCIKIYDTIRIYVSAMLKEFVRSAVLDSDPRAIKTLQYHYKHTSDCRNVVKELLEYYEKRLMTSEHMNLKDLSQVLNEASFLLWLVHSNEYQNKILPQQSTQKIINYLKRATEYGSPSASYNRLLLTNRLSNPSEEFKQEFIDLAQSSANAGHIRAQYQLALYHLSFQEDKSKVSKNLVDYLQNASMLGLEEAPLEMSIFYRDGNNIVKADLQKSAEYYDQYLVESHLPIGDCYQESFDVGFMYDHFITTSDNSMKAAFYYSLNIKNQFDSAYAQCYLAKLIEKKKISSAQIEDALKLYQVVAYLNCPSINAYAHYRLGKIYSNPTHEEIHDDHTAKNHYQAALRLYNDILSQSSEKSSADLYHLGVIYNHGHGTTKSISIAMKYFQAASSLEDEFLPIYEKYYVDKAKHRLIQSC